MRWGLISGHDLAIPLALARPLEADTIISTIVSYDEWFLGNAYHDTNEGRMTVPNRRRLACIRQCRAITRRSLVQREPLRAIPLNEKYRHVQWCSAVALCIRYSRRRPKDLWNDRAVLYFVIEEPSGSAATGSVDVSDRTDVLHRRVDEQEGAIQNN